jgi:hypothetical protein
MKQKLKGITWQQEKSWQQNPPVAFQLRKRTVAQASLQGARMSNKIRVPHEVSIYRLRCMDLQRSAFGDILKISISPVSQTFMVSGLG